MAAAYHDVANQPDDALLAAALRVFDSLYVALRAE
jgi:hypothetical protein